MLRGFIAACFVAALLGCGKGEAEPPLEPADRCTDPLELWLPDGGCIRPGIAPDGCAAGFVHDGEYGCVAILPPDPCPPGLMAVPGESECRPVMPCAAGRWGDIPTDANSEYVDGAYTGGMSDGSEARPWTTIGEAVSAAAAGAIVAIAQGSYLEDVAIAGKAVRLWGVCPEQVAIVATGQPGPVCPAAALCIHSGADGSEVRGVALGGDGTGVLISGAEQVLVEGVWVHDATGRGIGLQPTLGPTSLTLRGSLLEQNHAVGLYVSGSVAVVEGSVVRATQPDTAGQFGRGMQIQGVCTRSAAGLTCDPAARASATVATSLLEQNHAVGISVVGSDLVVDASVVRATQPLAADASFGRGISIQLACDDDPADPACDPAARSSGVVRGSVVEDNHDIGLFVMGSDASVESTVVRATQPRALDGNFGYGINAQLACWFPPAGQVCDPAARSVASVSGSLVEQSYDAGIFVGASDVTVEATVVRDTQPSAFNQMAGYGFAIQPLCEQTPMGTFCDPSARSNAVISSTLVAASHAIGMFVAASDASVDASMVRDTLLQASDGTLGDGITVVSEDGDAAATLARLAVENSARAGISTFGGVVSLGASRIECAAFALAGESYEGRDYVFEDRGGNRCGCGETTTECKAVSVGLSPPAPVTPSN